MIIFIRNVLFLPDNLCILSLRSLLNENRLIVSLKLPNCVLILVDLIPRVQRSPYAQFDKIPSFFHARCSRIYVAGMYASVIELNVSASATSSLRRYALLIATRSYEDYN